MVMLSKRPATVEAYRAESIVWFVLDEATSPLVKMRDEWIRQGLAREAGCFGKLGVVALVRS